MQEHPIHRLEPPVSDADLRGLAELLVDAIDSGAAVSFMAPLDVEAAGAWWRQALASDGAVVLVARDARGIVATVQLHRAWAPNQPHRGDVAKLIVHRRARGAGLGRRLMEAVEDEARTAGLRLLTLDAKRGGAAERLYRAMGWTVAGVIPRYALDPDGAALHDTVIFFKELQPA